jgi:3-oxoacyl-[acyl-carrier-protein] synthase II
MPPITTQFPRVVVTGLGAFTPLGPDLATTWRRLIAGEDAAAPVTVFDVSGCRCRIAGEARPPEHRRWSRATRLVMPAVTEALAQAGLLDAAGRSKLRQLPVSVSTTGGGMALGEQFMRALLAQSKRAVKYFQVSHYPAQRQMLELQAHLDFNGPITLIANACASGANAIGHARDLIRTGRAECVLTGGYESLTELIYVGFDCLQAMTTERCRPFDRQRSGLMLGEAAAFLVLESEQHARRRGAKILCELAGYGHTTDLHHLTQPNPAGEPLIKAVEIALADAQIDPREIGYLNAHGTATPLNDASECAAFARIFGTPPHLDPLPQTKRERKEKAIPSPLRGGGQGEGPWPRISSTKAAIGHTLGAAGSMEAVFAIQALLSGELPPQINLREADASLADKLVVPGERRAGIRATMSVNLGFGGSNAALIFTKCMEGGSPVAAAARRHMAGRGGDAAPTEFLPVPLKICGVGAVSPAGIGLEALLRNQPVSPVLTTSLGGRNHFVFRVDAKQPQLARWQSEARLRRTSAIALFMLEAAQQALDVKPRIEPKSLGIVAAFGTGAVIQTRKFYEGVIKKGARFASPNLFPETVFNSPTSHVAAVLGVSGPCYSVLGDESAWVNAVGVAATWLSNRVVEHVLVIGAEEFDPIILDAYAKVRWIRRRGAFIPAEGAGALLLRLSKPDKTGEIAGLVEGFTYRNKHGAREAASNLVGVVFKRDRSGLKIPPTVFKTAQRNWFAGIETELIGDLSSAPDFPYCGEAFTASAAWHTIRALAVAREQRRRVLLPVWGLTGQCSALILQGG